MDWSFFFVNRNWMPQWLTWVLFLSDTIFIEPWFRLNRISGVSFLPLQFFFFFVICPQSFPSVILGGLWKLVMKTDSRTYPRIVQQHCTVHLWSWDRKVNVDRKLENHCPVHTLILNSSNCSFSFLHRCWDLVFLSWNHLEKFTCRHLC